MVPLIVSAALLTVPLVEYYFADNFDFMCLYFKIDLG